MTRHHVLRRDLRDVKPCEIDGVTLAWVNSPSDPLFDRLVRVAAEQGVDEAWCREQLDPHADCVLALDLQGEPVGMGLATRRPFWVEEILHTLDPSPDGAYLYATYVTPSHRGKRIQLALDAARMMRHREQGASVAYAVVDGNNEPSVRSHARAGFETAATVRLWRKRNRALAHVRFEDRELNRLLLRGRPQLLGWRYLRIPSE